MASRFHRLCRTAILGSGSIVLGVGLINYGFDYITSNGRLYSQLNCLCEPKNNQNEIPEKSLEVKSLLMLFSGTAEDR